MINYDDFDALTFDCYGTLIDWESGILSGLKVAVIDDGVESGSTAMAIGAMLRGASVNSATLVVPVCPKSVVPHLLAVYDTIHAVVSPPTPSSLTRHYEVN